MSLNLLYYLSAQTERNFRQWSQLEIEQQQINTKFHFQKQISSEDETKLKLHNFYRVTKHDVSFQIL